LTVYYKILVAGTVPDKITGKDRDHDVVEMDD
jgi:hypothetical protein